MHLDGRKEKELWMNTSFRLSIERQIDRQTVGGWIDILWMDRQIGR